MRSGVFIVRRFADFTHFFALFGFWAAASPNRVYKNLSLEPPKHLDSFVSVVFYEVVLFAATWTGFLIFMSEVRCPLFTPEARRDQDLFSLSLSLYILSSDRFRVMSVVVCVLRLNLPARLSIPSSHVEMILFSFSQFMVFFTLPSHGPRNQRRRMLTSNLLSEEGR